MGLCYGWATPHYCLYQMSFNTLMVYFDEANKFYFGIDTNQKPDLEAFRKLYGEKGNYIK